MLKKENTLSADVYDITEKGWQRQKDRFPAYTEDIQKNAEKENTLSADVDDITEKGWQKQKDRFPVYIEDIQKNADRDTRTHSQLM